MSPVLFTARHGVVFWRMRPVPDWTAKATLTAINREGLEVPVQSRDFPIWLDAYEQLRDAVFNANNQRFYAPEPPRAA